MLKIHCDLGHYLSLGEWPRLPFTARIERAQFHRARSASKKDTWPLPPLLADFFSILLDKEFEHGRGDDLPETILQHMPSSGAVVKRER